MKKLLIGVVLALALGCSGKAVKDTPVDFCDDLRSKPLPEVTVTYNEKEYQAYMYNLGKEMSWKMQQGDNPACTYAYVQRKDVDFILIGEYCADVREDGLYLCEKACAYNDAGEEKGRSDRCNKIGG